MEPTTVINSIGNLSRFDNYKDENGNTIRLTDYKGKKIVLYFYPKDSTPGCTAEACNLRDNYSGLQKLGFEIGPVFPHFHRVALHQTVAVLAADTRLGQRQKHAL